MNQISLNGTVALMIACVGGISGFLLFGGGGPGISALGLAPLAGMGALVGGFCTAGLFGRTKGAAAGFAILGAFLSTALGAGLGGLMFAGAEGLALAPILVFLGLVTTPAAGIGWVAMMVGVHFAARRLRRHVAQTETECSETSGTIRP